MIRVDTEVQALRKDTSELKAHVGEINGGLRAQQLEMAVVKSKQTNLEKDVENNKAKIAKLVIAVAAVAGGSGAGVSAIIQRLVG